MPISHEGLGPGYSLPAALRCRHEDRVDFPAAILPHKKINFAAVLML
jgi:hypothetical protein